MDLDNHDGVTSDYKSQDLYFFLSWSQTELIRMFDPNSLEWICVVQSYSKYTHVLILNKAGIEVGEPD